MIRPNFSFRNQFGFIYKQMTGNDQFVFASLDGKLYSIPESLSEKQIEDLMSASVAQKENLLFPLVKDNELILDPNADY